MIRRRHALALPALLAARPAAAQAWSPDRPLRLVVGFPPGGSLDVLARLYAEAMAPRLGQPVLVENRPGAGGTIGADAVVKATADGHTIAVAPVGVYAINRHLYASMPFDPDRDLTPLTLVWEFPNVAVVPTEHVPATDLASFIPWAKARRGGISYGSPGIGTTPHLSGALFFARTGIEGVHIPFRGAAQTIPAMLGGEVQFALDNLSSYLPVIREGRMRALGISSAERWPSLPEVPTLREAGLPDLVVTSWTTFAVAAATPPAAQARLGAAIAAAAADPTLLARAELLGARIVTSTPEATRAFITAEQPKWRAMVEISGAKPG